jgi:hypothetical protein
MSQHQQWITIDSCIYDYISEAEISQNKYFKLFHLAFGLMDSLGIDFFYQIKTVKLPINANKTVTLPADFLNYTKLGILNGVGELIPLKYNDKLTTYNDLRPERVADTEASNFANYYSFSSPIFYNYWNGSAYENMYGLPGGYIYAGGFKIDTHNGVILLDSAFGWSGLVLEYTASPQEGGEYYIPVQFRRTMIAWLAWMDIANIASRSHISLGEKQARRHEYFEARRLGIRQFRPFYLDQAYIANLETSRLVVKA